MNTQSLLETILITTLQLDKTKYSFDPDTKLFGNFPEFDSVAIVTIIAAIEDAIGCEISDKEISAEIFDTFGTLLSFVDEKAGV